MTARKPRYVAVRTVSWAQGDREVVREPGEDVSNAPAAVLADLVACGAVEVTSG